jgi:hypothetical protein
VQGKLRLYTWVAAEMNHIQQNQNGSAKFITDLSQRVLLLSAVCRICGHGTDRREKVITETVPTKGRGTFMKAMCIQSKCSLNF